MRQRRWLKLLKDYDCEILYHPGKANVVADALSRKGMVSYMMVKEWDLLGQFIGLRISVDEFEHGYTASLRIEPSILDQIRAGQRNDKRLLDMVSQAEERSQSKFTVSDDGLLRYRGRICVPHDDTLRQNILKESYCSIFTLHPGSTKMYQDLRKVYWQIGIKKDVTDYVARCLVYQQIKVEHQRPAGLLKSLPIPTWKQEHITMDFIMGLLRTQRGHDAVWVIVDRLVD